MPSENLVEPQSWKILTSLTQSYLYLQIFVETQVEKQKLRVFLLKKIKLKFFSFDLRHNLLLRFHVAGGYCSERHCLSGETF
jgi:hypothetical protein